LPTQYIYIYKNGDVMVKLEAVAVFESLIQVVIKK